MSIAVTSSPPKLKAILTALRSGSSYISFPPSWLYAGRAVLAALLALYLAFALELDSPFSAAATVLIVSHPVHGMVWSKSFYRALGTLIGALVAILLTALFAQTPELYLLCFGLWMGLATAVSTVLRSFRSYSAILAGYTVALITFPNLPGAPDSVFTLVTARLSTVLLGVTCSALVGSLLTSRTSGQVLEQKLRVTLAALVAYVQRTLTPGALPGVELQRQTLRGDITAVDNLVEFAAAEGTEIAGLVDTQRFSVAAMFASLTAAAAAHDALTTARDHPGEQTAALLTLVDTLSVEMDALSSLLAGQELATQAGSIKATLQKLAVLKSQIEDSLFSSDFHALRAFDRLDDLFDDLTLAVEGLTGLLHKRASSRQVKLAYHIDWRWAAINGVRATLAVWLAAALWIFTAWPAGGMMIGAIVPTVGLLSLRDRPDLDALEFVKGISLATLAGLFCLLYVLPHISGFPLLVVVLGTFIFWGALQTTHPQRAFLGVGFLVFFLTLLAPTNAMRYDIAAFLNNSLAVLCGAALTSIIHRVVLPIHPRQHVRTLVANIRSDVQAIAGQWPTVSLAAWETRMHDRLLQLAARLRTAGGPGEDLLHGTHAALRIGREIIRLRELLKSLADVPGIPAAGATAFRAIGHMSTDPRRAVRTCHLVARRFLRSAAQDHTDTAITLGKAANSLLDIALLLGRHRHFFRPGTRIKGLL